MSGQVELPHSLEVHPRRITEPNPEEKHNPLVTRLSAGRQQWVTGADALQGISPAASVPSG